MNEELEATARQEQEAHSVNERQLELVGKLAVHKQGIVDYTVCMFYDEAIELEQALEDLKTDLPAAKKYRDLFFGKLEGTQLPGVGFALTNGGEEEAQAAEKEVESLFE